MKRLIDCSIINPSGTFLYGFTGHDQLDSVGLIDMIGRIYDPRLGRFIQADPVVQDGQDLQAYNRYAYVRNNPLTLTDPSGFSYLSKAWKHVKHAVHDVTRAIGYSWAHEADFALRWSGAGHLLGAIDPQLEQYALAVGSAFCGPAAPACAAAGSYAIARTHGASIDDAAKGAAIAGVSAYAFNQLGDYFNQTPLDSFATKSFGDAITYSAESIVAHGMVGGVMSSLSGGRFGDGFVAAGLSTGLSLTSLAPGTDASMVAARIAIAAISGGTVSELTGGKFANGAVSAAFSQAFNDEKHYLERVKELVDKVQDYIGYGKAATEVFSDGVVASVNISQQQADAADPTKNINGEEGVEYARDVGVNSRLARGANVVGATGASASKHGSDLAMDKVPWWAKLLGGSE